jgi:tetratricopeptide (TPR) repeat protein
MRDEVFEVGSFVQSAMYAAGVTCSDCHDAHSGSLRTAGNAVCGTCHLPSAFDTPLHHRHDAAGSTVACVDCHMRAETYMVVDSRRDHSFRIPRPDLSVSLGTPNACNDCHRTEGAQWAAERVREWFPQGASRKPHYGTALHAGRHWRADRATQLRAAIEDREVPAIARATAVKLLAQQVDGAALEALARTLQDDDALVQLAALEALAGVPVERRPSLAQRFLAHPLRALRITAAAALVPARVQLSERGRGELTAAVNEYIAAQRFNSDRAEGPFNEATLRAAAGDLAGAEQQLRAALAREPTFAAAYVNLADLYRQSGREPDAESLLRAGLALNPAEPELQHALGLSLVRSGRLAEAVPMFEAASELGADRPAYRYVLGVALSSAGERERALDVLEEGARRFPAHVPTLFALATIHRDAGRIERALEHARRLLEVSPTDETARALAAQLEARIR